MQTPNKPVVACARTQHFNESIVTSTVERYSKASFEPHGARRQTVAAAR